MENFMNKELDLLVSYIKNTSSYQKCVSIKDIMDKNEKICRLVSDIKVLQKKYVKSGFSDSEIENELNSKEKELNCIPLYIEYMNNLEEVNEMINLVKDELNDYFDKLLVANED